MNNDDDRDALYQLARADMAQRHHQKLMEAAALRITQEGDADFTLWAQAQAIWRKREGIES